MFRRAHFHMDTEGDDPRLDMMAGNHQPLMMSLNDGHVNELSLDFKAAQYLHTQEAKQHMPEHERHMAWIAGESFINL